MSLQATFSWCFLGFVALAAQANNNPADAKKVTWSQVQLGARPLQLVADMAPGKLKSQLEACAESSFDKSYRPSKFSIGHRGAPLHFPEHTVESYVAAAKMGAGLLECDVTFTQDRVLVCRHSQCDLHRTTTILETPLAEKCSTPPAFDPSGNLINAPFINCCTSDITAAEFKSLQGKMDSANKLAPSIAEYMRANDNSVSSRARGTLLTHAESIALFDSLGVDFIPELKSPEVAMPFQADYTQQRYAQQLIDEYRQAGIAAERVWLQSFNYADLLYWIKHEPAYGKQVVYLEGAYNPTVSQATMASWRAAGVQILAPPMWILLKVNAQGEIVPSDYARKAQAAGLKLMTWTLERSGSLKDNGGWYYQTLNGERGGIDVIRNDGDVYTVLHALAQDVGIQGIFSDWPATVSYYANCMGLK